MKQPLEDNPDEPRVLPAFQRGHQAEFRSVPGEERLGATPGFKLPRSLPGGRELRGKRK